jgi:hypothetical protein
LETIAQLYSDEPYGELVVPFENQGALLDLRDRYIAQSPKAYQELAKRRVTISQNLVSSLLNEGFCEHNIPIWTERTLIKNENVA